jgi:uncharacterized protein
MVRSLTLALAVTFAVAAHAQSDEASARKRREYIRANYTKYEFQIPMRDGVKLFTGVYSPKDTSVAYPILMRRTPYSIAPYGADNYPGALGPSEVMSKERFIFVYQDVRGRFLSEGEFEDLPAPKPSRKGTKTDESTDAFDTIEWLIAQVPNNNGRAGIWGVSYDGTFATFALIGAHPALKAVSPQAPMADAGNGDDAYHNGAFYLAQNFDFYTGVTGFQTLRKEPSKPKRPEPFDFGTTDEYEFFLNMGPLANSNERHLKGQNPYWNDLLRHPDYDEFWQARALAPHMKNVSPAVLLVSGWYDAEDLAGPQKLFRAIERNGPKAPVTLVIGPWTHSGWQRGAGKSLGNLNFASDTAQFYRENIELPFFVYHLKAKGKKQDPKAWMFETGANQWRKFEHWPPAEAVARSLYLQAGGKLSFSAGAADAGFDEYVSDPAKPVPVTPAFGQAVPGNYMTADQRFAARRTDVLVYQTAPLENDVTLAGPVTPRLRISTSGTDSDFIVKLIDVYPGDYPNPDPNPAQVHMGGYQQLIRGEPFRGKFRNSLSKPEPFVPGKREKIEFAMPDVLHTFRRGHLIMVQIQSSWFPLIDRNPQTFVDIPSAKSTDFQKAVERVYCGGADGSIIGTMVLEK